MHWGTVLHTLCTGALCCVPCALGHCLAYPLHWGTVLCTLCTGALSSIPSVLGHCLAQDELLIDQSHSVVRIFNKKLTVYRICTCAVQKTTETLSVGPNFCAFCTSMYYYNICSIPVMAVRKLSRLAGVHQESHSDLVPWTLGSFLDFFALPLDRSNIYTGCQNRGHFYM